MTTYPQEAGIGNFQSTSVCHVFHLFTWIIVTLIPVFKVTYAYKCILLNARVSLLHPIGLRPSTFSSVLAERKIISFIFCRSRLYAKKCTTYLCITNTIPVFLFLWNKRIFFTLFQGWTRYNHHGTRVTLGTGLTTIYTNSLPWM